jgi:hypothetical protein
MFVFVVVGGLVESIGEKALAVKERGLLAG